MVHTNKKEIYDYLRNHYQLNEPIVQKDIYEKFPHIKPGTIRQTVSRLVKEGKMIKASTIHGVYFLPNPNRVLTSHTMDFTKFIERKYLQDEQGEVIGYESGFVLANRLGLTSQTPSVTTIYSNAVADKKRAITISNRRFVINKPKVQVTSKNYKLLQVLDIISSFNKYSEKAIEEALIIFGHYLTNLELSKNDMEKIVSHYPIKTQLAYYKMEVGHAITSR